MSTVAEIKDAIEKLSKEEHAQLMQWLLRREMDDWEQQISADYRAGHLDKVIQEAEEDYKAGRCKEWPSKT